MLPKRMHARIVGGGVRFVGTPATSHGIDNMVKAVRALPYSALLGLGTAIGTWIYHSVTHGIEPETWYRAVFVGGFTFLSALFILGLKKLFWPARRVEN